MQVFVGHAIDQRAAVVVHQGFRQAGGATGIHNPQGVVERHPLRRKRLGGGVMALHHRGPTGAVGQGGLAAQVLQQDHVFDAGQGGTQFIHHADALVVFAAVGDAIDPYQHLGRDLFEPVHHGVGAHVGRTHAPNAADTHHRQKRHHGFRDVGQVGGDSVAGLHTLGLQMQRQRRHLAFQLGPRQFAALATFVVADDGGHARRVRRVHMAQHLLGVVHLGTHKPSRTRHDVALEHHAVWCR